MSKNSKKIIGVFAVLLLVLVAYVIVDFYPKTKPSFSTPLNYTLSVYPSTAQFCKQTTAPQTLT
jgi:hypothetical protein